MPSARFFNKLATLKAVAYPQDRAGGEVVTPGSVALSVACCVQYTGPMEPTQGQNRRGSVAPVAIFFRPQDPPGAAAVQALKVNDQVVVSGFPEPIVLDGPALDQSGRGVVYEATGRDIR